MLEMLAGFRTPVLVMLVLYLLGTLGVTIAVVAATKARWREVRPYLLTGALLAAWAFTLNMIEMMGRAWYFDVPEGMSPPFGEGVWRTLIVVVVVGLALLGAACSALQVGIAELAMTDGRQAYPVFNFAGPRRGWAIAAAFGAVAAIASLYAFRWLEVGQGEWIDFFQAFLWRQPAESTAVALVLSAASALGAAMTEEILFRGVIQGWLARWLGPGRVGIAGAIVLTSAFWTLGHAGMTDIVWIKCLQIFLIGLGLGGIARRFSVEASIVGHMMVNFTVVVAGYLMGGWTSG